MPNLDQFKNKEERNKWYREYRSSEKWKKYHLAYIQQWRAKNSNWKDNVRRQVSTAVKNGKLKKLPCKVCFKKKVEAHHDDYTKPLKVIWLCREHHRQRDVRRGTRQS